MSTFTAHVEFDPETQLYVAIVPGLPGAPTQDDSLDELKRNLAEVVALSLEGRPLCLSVDEAGPMGPARLTESH
jgi:predicted RNase H-like HicB family nuclease